MSGEEEEYEEADEEVRSKGQQSQELASVGRRKEVRGRVRGNHVHWEGPGWMVSMII